MIARRRGATALRRRAHARQWPGGPRFPTGMFVTPWPRSNRPDR